MQFDEQKLIKTIANGDPYKEDIIYGTPFSSETEPIIKWDGLIWEDTSEENSELKIWIKGEWKPLGVSKENLPSHTSTIEEGPIYGASDIGIFGHSRIINDLNESQYNIGSVLSAYQGYILNNKFTEHKFEIIMSANRWSNKVYTFNTTDFDSNLVTENSTQSLYPGQNITLDQLKVLQKSMIVEDTQSIDTFSIKALNEQPKIDIPIKLIIRRN